MSKSNLTLGVLAAAILVIGISVLRTYNTSPVSTMASPAGAIEDTVANNMVAVIYTDTGFEPVVVTVKRGDSVLFVNESGKALRIAPLNDPKDGTSAYLGFASSKSIGRGETYGVSLTQPGIWGYKSLQEPNVVGVVIVE